MAGYRLTEPAQADLLALADFIANESVDAAERVVEDLDKAMRGLAEMPGKGHVREDLTREPGVLIWAVGRYLVVYRQDARLLEVLRILHGSRDVGRELGPG